MMNDRIERVDSILNLVSWNVSAGINAINPRNSERQKEIFFRDPRNPRFRYDDLSYSLRPLLYMLEEIRLGDTPLEKMYDEKRKEYILKIKMLESLGTRDFAKYSAELYPPPDRRLVDISYDILDRLEPSKRSSKITRKYAMQNLRKIFGALGIRWTIRSMDIVASASVEPSKRMIALKRRERFSKDYFKRLAIHEIGTHVLRAENASLQELGMFLHGTANYLETEEGLAAFNEYDSGLMTSSILRNYAGRVIAVDQSSRHGFLKTFKHLKDHFSDETAWKLTLRAKRGLVNTGSKGGYTKDVLYLRGFIRLLEFSRDGGNIDDLYVGKISLEDMDLVSQIGLVPSRYNIGMIKDTGLVTPSERSIPNEVLEEIIFGR